MRVESEAVWRVEIAFCGRRHLLLFASIARATAFHLLCSIPLPLSALTRRILPSISLYLRFDSGNDRLDTTMPVSASSRLLVLSLLPAAALAHGVHGDHSFDPADENDASMPYAERHVRRPVSRYSQR